MGLVDGKTYSVTLTFRAIDGARTLTDIAVRDADGLTPELLGRLFVFVGNQTLAGQAV